MKDLLYRSSIMIVMLTMSSLVCSATWRPLESSELTEILKQVNRRFTDNDDYRVDVQMASFRGHASTAAYDTSSGFYARSGLRYHMFQLGIHAIQDNKVRVMVDPSDHLIIVANLEKDIGPLNDLQLDLMSKMSSKASIEDLQKGKRIRMEYGPGHQYERIVFTVNKDYWVTRVEMYFAEAITERPEDPIETAKKPKVIMTFSVPNMGKSALDQDLFDISQYIEWKKDEPVSMLKGYEVFDARVKIK